MFSSTKNCDILTINGKLHILECLLTKPVFKSFISVSIIIFFVKLCVKKVVDCNMLTNVHCSLYIYFQCSITTCEHECKNVYILPEIELLGLKCRKYNYEVR